MSKHVIEALAVQFRLMVVLGLGLRLGLVQILDKRTFNTSMEVFLEG